jgi:hypothetical protein
VSSNRCHEFQASSCVVLAFILAAPSIGLSANGQNSISYTVPASASVGPNGNPIEIGAIEFFLRSDKFTYDVGEPVDLLFRITNRGSDPVVLHSEVARNFGLFVAQNDDIVWWAGGPIYSPGGGLSIPLDAGQSFEMHYVWNMTHDFGGEISPGDYQAYGFFNGAPYPPGPLQVPMTVIPEPSLTSAFFMGWALLFIGKRGRP